MKTPVELVEQYVLELYNKQQIELVHELCADPVLRHEAGNVVALSQNQQAERIRADLASNQRRFEGVKLSGDVDSADIIPDYLSTEGRMNAVLARTVRFCS